VVVVKESRPAGKSQKEKKKKKIAVYSCDRFLRFLLDTIIFLSFFRIIYASTLSTYASSCIISLFDMLVSPVRGLVFFFVHASAGLTFPLIHCISATSRFSYASRSEFYTDTAILYEDIDQ
jgi:hypothetical protein